MCKRCGQEGDTGEDIVSPGEYWHDACWALMCLEMCEAPGYQGTDVEYWRLRVAADSFYARRAAPALH